METDTEDEEEEEDEDVVEDEGQDETAEEAEQSQDSVDSDVFAADSDEEKHTPIVRQLFFNSFSYLFPNFYSFQQVPGHTAKKRRIVESDEDGEALNDSGELGRSRSSRIAKRQKAAEPLPVKIYLIYLFYRKRKPSWRRLRLLECIEPCKTSPSLEEHAGRILSPLWRQLKTAYLTMKPSKGLSKICEDF